MDFFGKQEAAKTKTKLLMFYFLLAVMAIVLSVNAALWGGLMILDPPHAVPFKVWLTSQHSLWISLATIAVILMGSLLRMAQLSGGGKAVAEMVGARRILPETSDPLEKRLMNVVEEMSIASGTTPPRLYMLDEEQGINAFVAGTQAQEAVLVITRGALEQLNRDQLQGVIGHEYSHIAHGDMRLNIRLLGILAGILLIGQCGSFILRNLNRGSSSSSSDNSKTTALLFMVGLVLMVVGYIGLFFGRLIKAAVSRQREFLADAASVQYTRDNESIAGALAKIGLAPRGALLNMSNAEEMSHMCFGQSVHLSLNGLLATHPSINERIKALGFTPDVFMRRIANNEKPEPSEKKPTSDDDNKKIFTTVAATMATIGTINASNLEAAHNIKLDISDVINDAMHDRLRAPDLLIALLINSSGDGQSEALILIENQCGKERRVSVESWIKELQTLQPKHRLAILNAMRSTLDFLSEEDRSNLLDLLSKIVHIDQKVSLFEFVLLSLANKWLKPSPPPKGVVRRFVDVSADLSVVVGLIVMASGASKEEMQRQYENAMKSFSIPIQSLPTTFDAARLQSALDSLNRLVPMLKKPLMTTLIELVMGDKKLNVNEGELLRAISEQLNCPIPALAR